MLRSLKSRLIATYLLLILVSVGGLAGWIAPQLRRSIEEKIEHELEIEAHLAAIVLREAIEKELEGKAKPADLTKTLQSYAKAFNSELRITILNANLAILSSTDAQVKAGYEDRHPEILAALQGREKHDIRPDEYSGQERIFTAAPVVDGEKVIGFVQLSYPTDPMWLEITRAWLTLFGIIGIVIFGTLGASLWLAKQITAPLEELTALTQQLAAGDLSRRAPVRGPEEVQRLAQAFNEMTARLERLIQRQRDFVANAAHELRSPLTSMRLRLDLILNQIQEDPQVQRQYLEQLLEEIERLRKTSDQLLMLSSIDEGNRMPPEVIDLSPLLYQLSDEMEPLFYARRHQFAIEVPPHLPPVRVNPEQVRIIVRNLLDNAAKYTQPGGFIELRAEEEGDKLAISVRDNGPGISDETLPHIFERFYRGDKSRSRTAESGSGLGLSLVKELVLLNQGTIEVQTAPGKGSTFIVRFPIWEKHT